MVRDDEWEDWLVKNKDIELCELYYPPYNFKRTGCKGCPFSLDLQSQLEVMERLLPAFEHYRVIEFDPKAVKSYNAIHGTNFAPQDITLTHSEDLAIVERDRYCYILTYSFPCQDLSLSGKGRGMKKGSGTRSGLLWEIERILDECNPELPQVLLMENVPQVHSYKNIDDFKSWISKLESLGYSNFVQDLVASDYGIPQNRKRCFCLSILGNYHYDFPKKIVYAKTPDDFLDKNVGTKYFLTYDQLKNVINWNVYNNPLDIAIERERESDSYNNCTKQRWDELFKLVCERGFIDFRYDEGFRGRVRRDICPTLTCKSDGVSGHPLLVDEVSDD